jgi:hypothetical protein
MTAGAWVPLGRQAGGALDRRVQLGPEALGLPTGRTSPGGLALVRHCGLPIRRRCNATRTPADGLLQIVRSHRAAG